MVYNCAKNHACIRNSTILLKIWLLAVLLLNFVHHKLTWYANSADPDQTAPEGAVWSGSTLFAISLNILRNDYLKSKI